MNFKIRCATKGDCKDISRMIMELALYEKMTDQVKLSCEELERDGFCQNPLFECLVAEVPEENKSGEGFTTVGYGFYFYTYSTWKGRSMHLEDLYVMPEFRGGLYPIELIIHIQPCFTFLRYDIFYYIFLYFIITFLDLYS
ncbi:thialysine N-epsilon-acetyltransferase-like isoform X2 [Vanacampus margaritifer]